MTPKKDDPTTADNPIPEVFVQDSTPEELKESERQVAEAIADAKEAARMAGLGARNGDESLQLRLARRSGGGWTSFALELEGVKSAVHVTEIQRALNDIEGVRASVIYPTSTAWVTVPDDVNPEELIRRLSEVGVKAYLTRSSLRRRAERLEIANRRKRLAQHRHSRSGLSIRGLGRRPGPRTPREVDQDSRDKGRLRSDVRTLPREAEPTDVLFTARALLTPLRFIVSLALTIPVLVMNYYRELQFDYWQWVCLALATPVVLWGAWPFHRAMVAGLRRGMSALDAASSVAIISAYLWSIMMLSFTKAGDVGWTSSPEWLAVNHSIFSSGELFLDVACGSTVLLLAGRLATRSGRNSLLDEEGQNIESAVSEVTVVRKNMRSGKPVKKAIPLQEIRVGDDIIVPTGEVIPSDGRVIGGASTIVPGLIGGGRETLDVKVNSDVYAGGMNLGGPLKIRVQRTGSRTRLASMHRWIAEASQYQNRSAQLATRSASLLVPWALSLATLDFFLWWLISGNLNAAFATGLAMLACVGPVALALSTPIAMRLGIETSARRGVLMRNAETMRQLDEVTTVIFNRVGTLAKGEMALETITTEMGENPELVLRVAGALAMESDHPVSKALVRAAREARDSGAGGDEVPHWIEVNHVRITDGGNFSGQVEIPIPDSDGNLEMRTVDAVLWRPRDLSELDGRLATASVAGGTPLVVSWKGKARGVITLYDKVKDDAIDAVAELENLGLETMMLTRDTYPVARRFADNLGISKVLAGIAPGKKDIAVRSVHARGETVAMVGDTSVLGCLRVADIGVLMGSADDLDHDEADVVLLRDDVETVPEMIVLSRRVSALADRNIILAWTYNGIAMAAAAAGVLHPMAATVLMIASSLIIEYRSQRVRKF